MMNPTFDYLSKIGSTFFPQSSHFVLYIFTAIDSKYKSPQITKLSTERFKPSLYSRSVENGGHMSFRVCENKITHCVWKSISLKYTTCHYTIVHTVYPKKYAHGFVVLCFVVVIQSFIMNSHEVFIHIHQGCFAGTGAIVRLPQCQWSKPDGYGKISQCITTTKHSKAKTVCIFIGIYCMLHYSNYECTYISALWNKVLTLNGV